MASLIRNRRSGFYYAQFYSHLQKPNRKTVSLKTRKKRVAERALAKLEDAVALGEVDPWAPEDENEDELSVMGVAVGAYLKSCRHLKSSTQRTYREILFPFRDHLGSGYPVSKISVRNILTWLDSTSAGDVTRRKYVNHLGYFFRFLLQRGEISTDLSKKVPLRKVPELAPKAMTKDEVDALVWAIREYARDGRCRRDYTWLGLLVEANVYLGLRRGELIHLQWDHVDLERGILVVRNSAEFTTKSSRERSIPLCERSKTALRSLLSYRVGKYVFHVNGQKLKAGTLTKLFLKFRRQAGLPEHINLHSTRHTFGTWLAERGTPVTVIQTLMGHSSVTTTERYMSTRADVAETWVRKVFDT